jgi:hypothetical protein
MRLSSISASALVVIALAIVPASATAACFNGEAAAMISSIDHPAGWLSESDSARPDTGPDNGGFLAQFSFVVAPEIPFVDGTDDVQSWIGDEALSPDWPP